MLAVLDFVVLGVAVEAGVLLGEVVVAYQVEAFGALVLLAASYRELLDTWVHQGVPGVLLSVQVKQLT